MDDTGKALSDALQDLKPTSLDDIIRANRHQIEVKLASEEQLAPLLKPVGTNPYIKGEISDWRFIATTFDFPEKNFWLENVHLIGLNQGEDWITSKIELIDLERRLVVTTYSVYRLIGDPGVGEPDEDCLKYICATFHY